MQQIRIRVSTRLNHSLVTTKQALLEVKWQPAAMFDPRNLMLII